MDGPHFICCVHPAPDVLRVRPQIRQPWDRVVPLLEIPVMDEHVIGVTRLVFDERNQVTRGVGMYSVADGTNRGTRRANNS